MNNVLLIEPYTPETYQLMEGFHGLANCHVLHSPTVEDGLLTMERTYCDVVLVSIGSQPPNASKTVEQIRLRAADILVRSPEVMLLFDKPLPVPDALRCKELGAMCLWRGFPQAIYEEVRLAFWKRATRKHAATIRVDYRNGHHLLFAGSPPTRVDLGAQLTRMAVLVLSDCSCTVEFLADELGICRQSVKKYFLDLRLAFERLQTQCEVGARPDEIFWMEKRPGGTVCGVRANVIWS